jgi:hypothetical protein
MGWLVVAAVVAVGVLLFKGKQKAEAERLRAFLRLKIANYREIGAQCAWRDRYFNEAVKQDAASGRTAEGIERNRQRAVDFEESGRGFIMAAVTLEAVIKHA